MVVDASSETVTLSRRRADDALIEFEQRPSGYRAYHFTPPGGERLRFPSVTTVLGDICPKQGLRDWYEEQGAIGALRLERSGVLAGIAPEHAIDVIREARQGVAAVHGPARERGVELHGVLETYARDGETVNPADYPPEWHGYIRGLFRWIIDADLIATHVEHLVAHHELRYAGRFDVRGFVRGLDSIVDLKTRERPRVYFEDLLQVAGYDLADEDSGAPPATQRIVVAIGPDGTFEERMSPDVLRGIWTAGLVFHNLGAPVRSYFESQERAKRKAAA